MDRTHEPAAPLDGGLIRILVARDGAMTSVVLSSGRALSVFNIAWAYDEGESYAHVTTNVSPFIEGEPSDLFFTNEVVAVHGDAGELLHGAL
jgi:hypothetical protein